MGTATADLATMKRLVIQVQQRSVPDITPFTEETQFVSDLGLKSLELIGLVFMCEQTFDVSLVSHAGLLAKLHTVGQAVDLIRQIQEGGFVGEELPSDAVRAS